MNPKGKRVFLTLEEPKVEAPKSGIAYSAEETKPKVVKATIGVVAKIGSQVNKEEVNVGDRVYLGEFYPDPQNVDGELYIIVDEDKIVAGK